MTPAPIARRAGPAERVSATVRWALIAAGLTLGACAYFGPLPDVPPRPANQPDAEYVIGTPFVEADFAPYGTGGSASIAGRAYMVRGDGQVVSAAGQPVVLVPWNDYTREIRAAAEAGYQSIANRDPRYGRYRRTTTADGDGRFTFSGLPAGDWSLMTSVIWEEAGRQQRDFMYENVTVGTGGRADVVISRGL